MAPSKNSKSRSQKTLAILSAGAVLAIGATYTLASWTDTEWIWGGLSGDANVGTSTFEVQQNTDLAVDTAAWTDAEINPGGELIFSVGSLTLSPGDSIYAPVALRTTANSIAGTVVLNAAVAATSIPVMDTGGLLWDAIEQRVVTSSTAFTCDATAFTAGTPNIITAGALGIAAEPAPGQTLSATSGSTQYYCFELTLPASEAGNSALQGRTIAPAWQFLATSS